MILDCFQLQRERFQTLLTFDKFNVEHWRCPRWTVFDPQYAHKKAAEKNPNYGGWNSYFHKVQRPNLRALELEVLMVFKSLPIAFFLLTLIASATKPVREHWQTDTGDYL